MQHMHSGRKTPCTNLNLRLLAERTNCFTNKSAEVTDQASSKLSIIQVLQLMTDSVKWSLFYNRKVLTSRDVRRLPIAINCT